jgi:hypothetical protein
MLLSATSCLDCDTIQQRHCSQYGYSTAFCPARFQRRLTVTQKFLLPTAALMMRVGGTVVHSVLAWQSIHRWLCRVIATSPDPGWPLRTVNQWALCRVVGPICSLVIILIYCTYNTPQRSQIDANGRSGLWSPRAARPVEVALLLPSPLPVGCLAKTKLTNVHAKKIPSTIARSLMVLA